MGFCLRSSQKQLEAYNLVTGLMNCILHATSGYSGRKENNYELDGFQTPGPQTRGGREKACTTRHLATGPGRVAAVSRMGSLDCSGRKKYHRVEPGKKQTAVASHQISNPVQSSQCRPVRVYF